MNRPDDWQPGDLALCIKMGPWRGMVSGEIRTNEPIRAGMICAVRRVAITNYGETALWFNEDRRGNGFRHSYRALRFRRIRPHTLDAEDAETIALLTGKPALTEALQ